MKGRFGAFDLVRQLVKTLRVRCGFLFQLLIIRQAVVLQKSKGGGHLFEIEHLSPSLIAGVFSLEPGLNVDSQTDFWARLTGPYVRFAITFPESIRTQAGKPLLTGSPKADCTSPLFDLIARLLHQGEERREVSGLLGKSDINGGPQSVLIGQRLFLSGLPLPIIAKLALAPGLGIFHDGEPVFQTQTVREPPQGEGRAPEVAKLPSTVKGSRIVVNV